MSNIDNFDLILEQINKNNSKIKDCFGKHVHWGYWSTPNNANEKFDMAAENLSKEFSFYAQIKNGQSILDVGCGFGGTVSFLNEHFSNLNLLGINTDARQIALAESSVHPTNQNTISFVQDDGCEMKQVSGKFDHIIAVESVFYFSSRMKFFEQSLKHLNEGGSITISDFIMSPFLIPTCKFLNIFDFKSLHPFGSLNFITLKKYYDLSRQYNLKIEVYDINRNTIPTYNVLKEIMPEFKLNKFKTFFWKRGIDFLKFLATIEFNRYLMIKFTRN